LTSRNIAAIISGAMTDKIPFLNTAVWEVTILGQTQRIISPNRSKAVTEALNIFVKGNPEVDFSLSNLRTKVRTRLISKEELLLEKTLNG